MGGREAGGDLGHLLEPHHREEVLAVRRQPDADQVLERELVEAGAQVGLGVGVVGELLEGLVVQLQLVEGGGVRLEAGLDGDLEVHARLGEPGLTCGRELGGELFGEALGVLLAVVEVVAGRLHARVPALEVLVARPVVVGAAELGHGLGRGADRHRGLGDRRRELQGVARQPRLGQRGLGGSGALFGGAGLGDEAREGGLAGNLLHGSVPVRRGTKRRLIGIYPSRRPGCVAFREFR
ncbi:hypothetical protein D3C86_1552820 [compost metagenome]